jgi:hypothetical protein
MTVVINHRWFACLPLLASYLLAVPATFGQSTGWAPSRTTTRPGDAGVTSGSTSYVPEWQRTPGSTTTDRQVVRASANVAATTTARPMTSRDSNAAQMAFDVQLAPGEKLVGQPTYSEGRPAGDMRMKASSRTVSHFAPKGEILPTPDDVSSRRMSDGEIVHEAPMDEGEMHFDPDFDFEYGGDAMHGSCSSCGDGSCGNCANGRDVWDNPPVCPDCGMYGYHFPGCNRAAMCLENCYGFLFRESSIFGGVQSFKGPLDQGQNGNYGFNEGFNLVGPLVPFPRMGVGYQVGARWTQSDLSGNAFNSSSRNQIFLTAALYHRAYRNRGFQWGVAYDWLTDDYYVKTTLAQMRFETSWLFRCGHEVGFWGSAGVKNDSFVNGLATVRVKPINQYNLFYRYTSEYGSQARFWGGLTGGFNGSSFGIVGADFRVPMSNRADLVGGFNYIVPNDGGMTGTQQESWGLGMNLVWYFGRRKDGIHNTPFRPLFNVADNTVFMHQPLQ